MHRAPELGFGLPPSLWSRCRTSLGFGLQRRAGKSLALSAPLSAPCPGPAASAPSTPIPPCCRRGGSGRIPGRGCPRPVPPAQRALGTRRHRPRPRPGQRARPASARTAAVYSVRSVLCSQGNNLKMRCNCFLH